MTRPDKKKFFLHSIAIFIILYFVYHSVFGNRGLIQLFNINNELNTKEVILAKKNKYKENLQLKVGLLYDNNLDIDFLDELTRKHFGLLKDNETMIIMKKKSES